MAQPIFFQKPPPSTLADIAASTRVQLADPSRGDLQIRGLASLDEAGPMHLTFFDNIKYCRSARFDQGGRVPRQRAF